ncbi:hypothetical protein ACFPN7_40470 [Amycolatopsis halotolerans]|uniref:hypothetical protein n=1 Tax=Amycolatopsis halotolerans TaxID=330083 RepID=UPI0036185837
MATVTVEQVRAAREQGYAAGYGLAPPTPNPYAPRHTPEWLGPRTSAERVHQENAERRPLALARVWRLAYQNGQAAYAREHSATN